ncbi:hypothetical protein E2C01_021774 [Portunus trituberculatus]|uniref:Uncharacterized protein n=1 Tax=Portunus trituberculatus TaxID=210409 RepID=A0A5B7E5H2_PORTR|nr:hypothetical protein [Portunus trituberculatus]
MFMGESSPRSRGDEVRCAEGGSRKRLIKSAKDRKGVVGEVTCLTPQHGLLHRSPPLCDHLAQPPPPSNLHKFAALGDLFRYPTPSHTPGGEGAGW